LQGLGYVRDRGVSDGDAAEFSAFAIFALQLGAIRREVNGNVLYVAVLNLGQEVRVVGLVFVRGLAAGGRHAPQHDCQQDHQEPKQYCADCRVHLNYLTLFRPVLATPRGLELVALPVLLPTAQRTANYLDAGSEPGYSTGGSVFQGLLFDHHTEARTASCAVVVRGRHPPSPNDATRAFQYWPDVPVAPTNTPSDEHPA
jgi:hypothetical protein